MFYGVLYNQGKIFFGKLIIHLVLHQYLCTANMCMSLCDICCNLLHIIEIAQYSEGRTNTKIIFSLVDCGSLIFLTRACGPTYKDG